MTNRREFLTGLTLASAGLMLSPARPVLAAESRSPRYPLIVFSKAFQELSFSETAELVAEVGWDGIECPVRKGGQVLPERVEEDLPKLVEALGQRQRALTMMATDILGTADPLTEKVLRVASKLGIKTYRLGFFRYRSGQPIPKQLAEIRAALRDLVALNQELGLCAGFQNHSGSTNVGAPVWDIYELLKDFDRRWIGACFDIGHATIEGGLDWPLHVQLMTPLFRVVFVKDFLWKKSAKGWQASWCPLGEGMIHPEFFKRLQQSAFAGPINQHFEYPLGDRTEMVRHFKRDRQTLLQWLA